MAEYTRYFIFSIILLIISSFYGCAFKQQESPRIIDTIIIKNSTGIDIKKVSISDSHGKKGSISPVPSGMQQIYGRGSRVKRLPETLEIRWIDATNKVYQKTLSITSLLNSDSSNKGTTVIFDLLPYGVIKVYKK